MSMIERLEGHQTTAASLFPGMMQLPQVNLHLEADGQRERLEQYISGIFQASYDARILEYLPLLFSLEREQGITAALGLRGAGTSRLFSECYLDMPVEEQVKRLHGVSCSRRNIMELGNLVASSPGDSAMLYLLVTAAMHKAGIRYLLFAANRAVRISIRRTGFTPLTICSADPARLEDGGACWGNYYDGEPQVMLGDISLTWDQIQAKPALKRVLQQHEAMVEELGNTIRANH